MSDDTDRLESELAALAADVDWPETPDVSGWLRERITDDARGGSGERQEPEHALTTAPSHQAASARGLDAGQQAGRARIAAYLSHSYRPEDREVNRYFHDLFWDEGFAFTVDPKSERLALVHLEHMMKRSGCFVAVATHRPEVPRYRTSPFIVYEYGLAVQARKPRLVFLEAGVPDRFFEDACSHVFRRDDLPDGSRTDLRLAIEDLRAGSRRDAPSLDRGQRSAGLILPRTSTYRPARATVRRLLEAAGYRVDDVQYEPPNAFDLALQVDCHDFVVIDVGAEEVPDWLHTLLVGRFVPMLRLVHERRARHAEMLLAPVLGGRGIESVARGCELMMRWRTLEQLESQLEAELGKLQGARRQFRTHAEGARYFESLGRRVDGSVFVSSAGPDDELAQELGRLLDIGNVPVRRALQGGALELNADWSGRVRDQLAGSQLFLPLLSRAYWENRWCRTEYALAAQLAEQGKLDIHPCFLEDPRDCAGPLGAMQGRLLAGSTREDQVARMVGDVDDFLARRSPSPPSPSRTWLAEPQPEVDVAMITILAVEYEAVLRHLEGSRSAEGSPRHPNRYRWQLGEISSPARQQVYRVVLGLADSGGASSGLHVVRDTVRAFRPRHVLLVGIAGGIDEVHRGDVVVSDHIYGYEYGKTSGGFEPRRDWMYRTDSTITEAATTMEIHHPRWYAGLIRRALLEVSPPRIHIGPVASGDKVVEDLSDRALRPVLDSWPQLRAVEMEGLGAAEAIDGLREGGSSVKLTMVRGISHTPRRAARGQRPAARSGERERWRVVAADVAAALAVQLIRLAWPMRPRRAPTLRG